MMRIGTKYLGYIEHRSCRTPTTKLVRIYDRFSFARRFEPLDFARRGHQVNYGLLSAVHYPVVDAYHLINGCSLASRPWVSTLELPYSPAALILAIDRIRDENCHGLLCQSQWVYDRMVQRFCESGGSDAINKMQVLKPPQEKLADLHVKPCEGRVTFAFVGRAFRRKGGLSLLRAVDRLSAAEKAELHLIFVTNLSVHDWPSNATDGDVSEARSLISSNNHCVTHVGEMSQLAVLELYDKAHVAVIPSFCDAQAYGALECMSRGTPCITTDVGSLKEWNSNERGWLLDLKSANRANDSARREQESMLEEQLLLTIRTILSQRNVIAMKSRNAWDYVGRFHDPTSHSQTLDEIYSRMAVR